MAVTKIHKIKRTLRKAIRYVINEAKTNNGELVSTFGCSIESADKEFLAVSKLNSPETYRNRKYFKDGHDIKAYHLIQSFAIDDDVTPEKAHKLGKQFADEFLGGEFQYVVATHIDKGHIHNHIIFNATNLNDFKKFHLNQNKLHQREIISDRICKENNLSVIKKKSGVRSRGAYEYSEHKNGTSWKDKLRETIDRVILDSDDFDDFIARMEMEEGYEIKIGKYISFRFDDGQERFTRSRRLGEKYSEAAITYRIEHKEEEKQFTDVKRAQRSKIFSERPEKIYLIAPIENKIELLKSQHKISRNFENKLLIDEMNALVSSVNYLKKHELLYDVDFQARYETVNKNMKSFSKSSEKISAELTSLTTELKYLLQYFSNKNTALMIKNNPHKGFDEKSYQQKILYDSAVNYFKSRKINPNTLDSEKIKSRINELKSVYEKERDEHNHLSEERKKLYIISNNLSKSLNINLISDEKEIHNKKSESSSKQIKTENKKPQENKNIRL